MTGTLEGVVRGMFMAFDDKDYEAVTKVISSDGQGIDEIARRWLRGREQIAEYVSQLEGAVTDVRSELSDVRELTWGDVGVVTGWLEQDYKLKGTHQHVSAPTSVVLHREDGAWKIALLHSIPLPDES